MTSLVVCRAILNKSWRQHPTRHQIYGHLPSITKTIQVRRTRHAGHCWRSRDELTSDVLLWIPTYDRAKAGRPARTYIQSYGRIWDVALKTCQRRWTIGRRGERGSGISVLAARHDDDDNSWNIHFNINQSQTMQSLHTRIKILIKNILLLLFKRIPLLIEWLVHFFFKFRFIIFTNPSARAGYDTRSIF